MFIKYKNKEFVGFDDIRHKNLYNRYAHLKDTKKELQKQKHNINDCSVYSDVFDRYYFYEQLNYKIKNLLDLYTKENIGYGFEKLNNSYKENLDRIVFHNTNHNNNLYLAIRIFWFFTLFKEYFKFYIIIFFRNLNNAINRRITKK